MLTIPPPCWTNAAHKHGVVVLGTFITEWEDGAMQCAKIFHDKNSYQTIADQLVLLAKYYGFDGWLLNIENPIQVINGNSGHDSFTALKEVRSFASIGFSISK